LFPDDGADFETLLKRADTAMHRAKTDGRNGYRFVTAAMDAEVAERLAVHNGLRRALEAHQLTLYYQPQVRLSDGALIGAEALIRWHHPEHGLLLPDRFIRIAEEGGMIIPIGRWVLHEACRQGAVWQRAGQDLRIAVNLSALQFRDGSLETVVAEALETSGLAPERLELELTESVLLDINDTVLRTLERLRNQGIRLAIDDFGTGYSSLAYIKRLAVHRLKIDRTFIGDLDENPDNAAIASAVVQLAHGLGIETLAEGVEDARTLAILRDWNCEAAQGFLFGKPVPPDEFPTTSDPASPTLHD
jgi:diguanylate cyclase